MKITYSSYPYGYKKNQSLAHQYENGKLHNKIIAKNYLEMGYDLEREFILLKVNKLLLPSVLDKYYSLIYEAKSISYDKGVLFDGVIDVEIQVNYNALQNVIVDMELHLNNLTSDSEINS